MQTWNAAIKLIHIFRRWWLLVIFAQVQSGAMAGYLVAHQPRQYVAQTTIMVGGNLRSPKPSENVVGISLTLAGFYAEMARRTPITERVVERLNLPFDPQVLNEEMVSARVVPQAQLVEIAVLDTDPQRAAAIANSVADELIHFSPTSPEKTQLQRQFTQGQIDDLADSIKQTDTRMAEVTEAIQKMTSAGEISEAQQRLRELQLTKTSAQDVYSGLLATLNDSVVNSLSVFEPARPPTVALPQRLFPIVVVASLLGFLVGLVVAYVLDGLDDRWRRGRRPEYVVGEPTLASISIGGSGSSKSYPGSRERQIQALHGEILTRLAPSGRPTLLFTSAHASNERSKVAADLARLFAWSGLKTLLVDANLGEGVLSASFGITGDGVQHLLRTRTHTLAELVQPTADPNLLLLPGETGGPMSHVIPALHWPQLVTAAEDVADVRIIDGPSVLDRADNVLLAQHVGGIVLVVDPASETCSETRQVVERLRDLRAPLLGVVLLVPQKRGMRIFRRHRMPVAETQYSADAVGGIR